MYGRHGEAHESGIRKPTYEDLTSFKYTLKVKPEIALTGRMLLANVARLLRNTHAWDGRIEERSSRSKQDIVPTRVTLYVCDH